MKRIFFLLTGIATLLLIPFRAQSQIIDTIRSVDSISVLGANPGNKFFKNGIAFNASGFMAGYPLLKNKGQRHLWNGFYTRTGVIDFRLLMSRLDVPAKTVQNKDTASNVYASQFSLGANIPYLFPVKSSRKFGIKGITSVCNAGFGINLFDIGGDKAWGAYLEPSYSLQLPFVLIESRLQLNYNFKHKGRSAIVGGFLATPSVSLLFDGLWDVYDPKTKYTGSGSLYSTSGGSTTTTGFSTHYDAGGNYHIVSTAQTTYVPEQITSSSYSKLIKVHKAFIAWKPMLNLGASGGKTASGGIGFAARTGIFMFDAIAEHGKRNFGSAFDTLRNAAGNDRRYNLNGSVNATIAQARAGINLFTLISKTLFGRANKDYNVFTDTRFTRFYFGIGVGKVLTMSAPKYESEKAEANLTTLFTENPSVERKASNDMGLAKKGIFISKFVALEIGSFSLALENSSMADAKLVDNTYLHVGYLYPFTKVRKLYKGIKKRSR